MTDLYAAKKRSEFLAIPKFLRASHDFYIVSAALLLSSAIKIVLLLKEAVPFNSDEAIVALMARHILQGERPTFFYGQAYMGSLDAYLAAGSFLIFGERVLAIRVVQIVLYACFMISLWFLARRIFLDKRVAGFAVWIAAVPTVLLTTYTTATLGGYGEVLVLGNLILLIGYECVLGNWSDSRRAWISLGLVSGLAVWTLGMAGVYLLPVAIFGLLTFRIKNWSNYLIGAAGFFLASGPWWLYNFSHSGEALAVLTGTSNISLISSTPFQRFAGLVLLGIPSLLGLRYPWSPDYGPLPGLFLGLLLYLAIFFFFLTRRKTSSIRMAPRAGGLLGIFVLGFMLIFVGTHFGLDATGRYFLPLYVPLILAAAAFFNASYNARPVFGISLLLLLLALNGAETWRAAASADRITTQFDPITRFDNRHDQELIEFLESRGELRGYSNYWVSFRLAFLSGEEIVYAALLPYKPDLSYTPADNRYPRYAQAAHGSPRVAYITTKHPELDQMIREGFSELGVGYSEQKIGDYQIFYELSRAVGPEEIGLGIGTTDEH